jgi:predicted transcriptional regulator
VYVLAGQGDLDPGRELRTWRAGAIFDLTTGAALESMVREQRVVDAPLALEPTPLEPLDRTSAQSLAVEPLAAPVLGFTAVATLAALTLLAHGGWLGVLYARLRSSDLLAHPQRQRIYAMVQAQPGVHYRALVDALGMGRGATMYHLRVLERGRLLQQVRAPGYRRYYVSGAAPQASLAGLALLEGGSLRAVYDVVRTQPGISVSEVARRVQVSQPAAHKAIERLRAAGLVEKRVLGPGLPVQLRAREPRST